MLRKLSHIVLSILLLITTSGVTLSEHFCGGDLVSASIMTEPDHCCDIPVGCCEDRTVHFEIKNEFIGTVNISDIKVVVSEVVLPVLYTHNQDLPLQVIKNQVVFYDSSPPIDIQTRLSFIQSYLC